MDHDTIRKEAAQLKEIILNGNLAIPSFWDCVWPGLAMMAWIVICPFITFQMYIDIYMDDLEAVGGGLFVGFIISFMIFNMRSLYLTIPVSFRSQSKFLSMVRKKLSIYCLVYMIVVVLAAYLATYSSWKVILYVPPLIAAYVLIMVIGAADLGRYRVSAFASVLELLKSRKQGGE